ncbi:Transcription factor bHLH68 [Bienertia sinuspersici]
MMNRGVLQNSPVQQMMATGNPSWWNINNLMRPPLISSPSSSSTTTNFLAPLPNNNNHHHNDNDNNNVFHHAQYNMNMPTATAASSWLDDHHHPTNNHHQVHHQQLPESWSQLLLGGVFMGEEAKKMETTNWEEQVAILQQQAQNLVDVKQENSVNSYNNNTNVYGNNAHDQEFQLKTANWSHHHLPQLNIPVSSPQSCVTSFSTSGNNLLDFSSSISSDNNLHPRQPPPPRIAPPSNSGVAKKAKVQASSTQSTNTTFKVRKEKLGDRITALHQLVSPFGNISLFNLLFLQTDTASVLLEAIGYIRFLQSQIEYERALSLPYLNSGAGNKKQPHPCEYYF